jgi:effector-binding domain-containing protein
VFEVVADYNTWTAWSPWLIAEPAAKVTVTEDASSLGSRYAWHGDITGQGELEHKQLKPAELVEDELRFIKPFKTICRTSFHFNREGSGTRLTWKMDASLPWFLFWMIPMMKTLIGMDYQRGLTMLKDLIETGNIPAKTIVHGPQNVGPIRMAGIASSCRVDDVSHSMEKAFEQAAAEFRKAGLPNEHGMISVYKKFRMKEGIFEYISGFIIPEAATIPANSLLKTWTLPACSAFHVEQKGPYRHLGNGWSVANQICRHKKMKQQRIGTFEIYRNSPITTPESDIKTDIYLPLRNG